MLFSMSKTYSFKITKTIKAPRKKVYEAWTDLKAAKKWSVPEGCTITSLKSNFKVGGKYRLAMKTPYGPMSNQGVYLEIVPNQKIVYTFIWEVEDTEENLIKIEFKVKGKDTQLVMTGSKFEIKDEAAGNKEGWSSCIEKLAALFVK
jgi:uncharacterized protein YndB with AHSA1/START domain